MTGCGKKQMSRHTAMTKISRFPISFASRNGEWMRADGGDVEHAVNVPERAGDGIGPEQDVAR